MNNFDLMLAALKAAGPLLFVIICLMITYYDFKYCVIPNELIIVGITIRFLWMQKIKESLLFACLFIGAIILASLLIWFITKRRIGIGDFKLIFMLSLFAGLEQNIMGLFIALLLEMIALLCCKKNRFPFAPCIVLGWFCAIIVI